MELQRFVMPADEVKRISAYAYAWLVIWIGINFLCELDRLYREQLSHAFY